MTTKRLTPLDMGGSKIVNAANGTASTDLATVGQIPAALAGGTVDGPVTVNGQFTADGVTVPGQVVITGESDGSQYSNFILADDASGHVWVVSHRADTPHALLIYNYNGTSYTNALEITEAGAVTTVHNTLDDGSGNSTVAGTLTVTGAATHTGVVHQNGGTDTSNAAAASTPSLTTATAAQLSVTQDVMLYCNIITTSTFSLAIGPTSTPANTIVASASFTAPHLIGGILVPKGWYVKAAFTSADVVFKQVTC
jgi:hypothetical protein